MDTNSFRAWLAENTAYPMDVRQSVTILCNEVDSLERALADEREAGMRQFAWDAKCLRRLASVFGIAVPESDEAIVYAADRVMRQVTIETSELFGFSEQLKLAQLEIRNLQTALTQAQIGDCCKAPGYCDGECTCEICDPQGNIEYWKTYAGEAEKDNERLTADLDELSDETERLKERVNELDGIAYTNAELYNKEYLKREEAEARLAGADSMTAYWRQQYTHMEAERDKYKAALVLYADKTRWSRAWGDDEALLYNIRENGGDGWSIAQEALAETPQTVKAEVG